MTVSVRAHKLGLHRVIEPAHALPQAAWRLDNTPVAFENEILCDVETLNIDSASFQQLRHAAGDDPAAIAQTILETVQTRGKQHNPVTGSGGMFVGRVKNVGADSPASEVLFAGERIASLVSLTLTPLHIERIEHVDVKTGHVRVQGQAILFASSAWAKIPADMDSTVALSALDVAGAPAQVRRLVQPGMSVVVIGGDGKSGLLSCAQAKERAGHSGRVVAVVPDAQSDGAKLLHDAKLADHVIEADARDAVDTSEKVAACLPDGADLVVNCVNVPGTESSSILCARDGGTIYFFSMNTSFTAAALGAEGVGKDVCMMIGNGYAESHAEIALQTLRDNPPLLAYFQRKYGAAG